MISPFSKLIDYGVEFQLRKDPAGRLVFLPFGVRGKGYYVTSDGDAEKIRAFVKMYRSASTLISWLIMGIYIFGVSNLNVHYDGHIPLRSRVTPFITGSLVYMLVVLAFAWILWGVYKKTIPSFTSSLPEVGADLKRQLTGTSTGQRRIRLVCLGACLLLLGLVFFAVQYRTPKPCVSRQPVCQQMRTDSSNRAIPQS